MSYRMTGRAAEAFLTDYAPDNCSGACTTCGACEDGLPARIKEAPSPDQACVLDKIGTDTDAGLIIEAVKSRMGEKAAQHQTDTEYPLLHSVAS